MKIITLREKGWYDKRTEYRMWDHLCRAYGIPFEIVVDKDLTKFKEENIILFEENGNIDLKDFVHQEDKIYLFGRTGLHLQDIFPKAISVRIPTPSGIVLFGSIAAGIVLYDRWLKWQ